MVEVVKGKATEKYDVGEIIGRGKFSTVKLCTEKTSGKEFAVKILRTARRGCSRDAILNEVRIMNMCVECIYVLKLVEVFDGGREFHLVEELAECGDLYSQCLAEENHAEETEVRHYIKQLLSALVFIHERNIVHCDIKPENVLVTREDTDNIRLVDFGLARVVSPKDKVCEIVGTTEYVAPEILSFEPITAACDMWSLGVLAYTLLSGISPFLGDNDSETYANISHCDYDFDDEVFDNVSEDAQHFISELLEVKPRIRPGAHEMSTHSWMTRTVAVSTSVSITSTTAIDAGASSTSGAGSVSSSIDSSTNALADSPSHTPVTRINSNQNTLTTKLSNSSSNTGGTTTSTRGESTRNESVVVDQSSRTGRTTPFMATGSHVTVERAASLPIRERNHANKDIFNSQDDSGVTGNHSGNEDSSPAELEIRETPISAESNSLSRHRRSQSCKNLPSTVLIERQDPEASFTYLQEQALRLSDKIEAMLVERQQQQRRRSSAMSPVMNENETGLSVSLLAPGDTLTVEQAPAAHSTPMKKATTLAVTPVSSPQHDAQVTPPSSISNDGTSPSRSSGIQQSQTSPRPFGHALRKTANDAAHLLNKVRIHLKSSASISGMRQLERPRGPSTHDGFYFDRSADTSSDDFAGDSLRSSKKKASRVQSVDAFRRRQKSPQRLTGNISSSPAEVDTQNASGSGTGFGGPALKVRRTTLNGETPVLAMSLSTPEPGTRDGGSGAAGSTSSGASDSRVLTDSYCSPGEDASPLVTTPPTAIGTASVSDGVDNGCSLAQAQPDYSRSASLPNSAVKSHQDNEGKGRLQRLSIQDLSSSDLVSSCSPELASTLESMERDSGGRSGSFKLRSLEQKFGKAAALRDYWSGKVDSFPGVTPFSLGVAGLTVGAALVTPTVQLGTDPAMGRSSSGPKSAPALIDGKKKGKVQPRHHSDSEVSANASSSSTEARKGSYKSRASRILIRKQSASVDGPST